MTAYRVGLPTSLKRADGSAHFPSYDVSPLASEGCELAAFASTGLLPAETVSGFDSLILLGERFTAASVPADRRLLHIARMGVGYDTVDTAACTANDIVLTITPEAVRRPMAVACLTLLLALTGRLFAKDHLTRQGPEGWAERTRYHGLGLIGRTLGVVGLGNIGAEFVRLARPLEMNVMACDPFVDAETAEALGVELVDLETLFRESDVVSLNCPLTEETHHLADTRLIGLMKPTAYLLNTARGPVVDQSALYEALSMGRIAGAGLDVLDPEPSVYAEPLHALDNVILAPHALGWSDQMFATMAAVNMAAVRAIREGRVPANVVNPAVLERPGFQARLATRSQTAG